MYVAHVPDSECCRASWGQWCNDPLARARRSNVVPTDGWVMLRTPSGLEYPAAYRVVVVHLPAQDKPLALQPGAWAIWRIPPCDIDDRSSRGLQLSVRIEQAGPRRTAVVFNCERKLVPTHQLLPVDHEATVEIAREDRRRGYCGPS